MWVMQMCLKLGSERTTRECSRWHG